MLLLLLPLLKNLRTLPLLSPLLGPPTSLSPILSKLTLLPRCLSVAAGAVSSEVGMLPRRISLVVACGCSCGVEESSETLPNLVSFVTPPCFPLAATAEVPEALADRGVSSSSSSKCPNRISLVTLFCLGGGVNEELRRGSSVSSSSSSSGSSS